MAVSAQSAATAMLQVWVVLLVSMVFLQKSVVDADFRPAKRGACQPLSSPRCRGERRSEAGPRRIFGGAPDWRRAARAAEARRHGPFRWRETCITGPAEVG